MTKQGKITDLGDDRAALGARVAAVLRGEIESGRWAVGGRIPTERQLVSWMGVGRNTVREMVGSLVEAGLLHRQQGRGTFVIARSDLGQTLSRRAAANPRRDTLELRLALDSTAARLAAIRRTATDADDLKRLLAARAAQWVRGDAAGRRAADTVLHQRIVTASRNGLLTDVYDGLIAVFEDTLVADLEDHNDDPLDEVHTQLIAAIVRGDADDAEQCMRRLLSPLIDAEE